MCIVLSGNKFYDSVLSGLWNIVLRVFELTFTVKNKKKNVEKTIQKTSEITKIIRSIK